jgi:hypothetical protein
MLRRVIVLAAILACLAAHGAAADTVFPPGLRIGLTPPPGMSVSRRFPGFEDPDNKVSILLNELPAPAYDNAEKSLFAQTPPGVTVAKREMFPFADGIGMLLTGAVDVNGTKLHKWFLLAHSVGGANSDLIAIVAVEVPEAARTTYSDEVIRSALASVTFRPAPLAEQVAMLPFKLGDLAGFRIMQAVSAGGIILIDGPGDDISRQPYMIVSVGPGSAGTADDRAKMAQGILTGVPLKDLAVTSTEAMRIGNLPGFEIRATAKDLRGDSIKLVQWVRFGASGYMRIIGVTRPGDWDKVFDRFRAVRDGIGTK